MTFQRLSDALDLLTKVGCHEHVHVENRDTDVDSIPVRTISWSDNNGSTLTNGNDDL